MIDMFHYKGPIADFMYQSSSSSASSYANLTGPIEDESDYECLGWRQTTDCSPHGNRNQRYDRACNVKIDAGDSGYCEYRQKSTGRLFRAMQKNCSTVIYCGDCPPIDMRCDHALMFAQYKHRAMNYVHQPAPKQLSLTEEENSGEASAAAAGAPKRGIVINAGNASLIDAYSNIRVLRSLHCELPIELWTRRGEIQTRTDPILRELLRNYNVKYRIINDVSFHSFLVKPYSLFYTSFDQVLLLDADNTPVKDPTYLFDDQQFQSKGAIFWPDYWKKGNSVFGLDETSLLWEFVGLPFDGGYEQESGQLLIDRLRCKRALHILMFFAMTFYHSPFYRMRLVWGDKDLYRIAWRMANTNNHHNPPYYFVPTPPGTAGKYIPVGDDTDTLTLVKDRKVYCGRTMVQHDPNGHMLFFHRNGVKLSDRAALGHTQWWYQVRLPLEKSEYHDLDHYFVQTTFVNEGACFTNNRNYTVRTFYRAYGDLELRLLGYREDALKLRNITEEDEGAKMVGMKKFGHVIDL